MLIVKYSEMEAPVLFKKKKNEKHNLRLILKKSYPVVLLELYCFYSQVTIHGSFQQTDSLISLLLCTELTLPVLHSFFHQEEFT